MEYVQPKALDNAFTCPHCHVFSQHNWASVTQKNQTGAHTNSSFNIGCCVKCAKNTLWTGGKMVYPVIGNAPRPNPDLPNDIKIDYNEASDIVVSSPRSTCVLLRLCVEKICDEQNALGNTLNAKIGDLVSRGLDKSIAKSLDSVRVIGGQAVHPLEMDLRDDQNTATTLFKLVNYVSEWAYTRQNTINDIFESIPNSKKDAIEKRDEEKTQ